MTLTAGYDVGGAHLKVALVEDGRAIAVRQIPCALWQGLDRLDMAFEQAQPLIARAERHAVTMTGELCEVFPSRAEGVAALARHIAQCLGPQTSFYRGLQGFCDAEAAASQPETVGSANFLATAQVIARIKPHALLIDMGSTTTDIVACDRPQGLTDAERLQTGELVYTGLTRTPVASVTTRGVLLGQWQTLARDTFATMADVRRVLGLLPCDNDDNLDQHTTADGKGKSVAESLTRLGRGFGRDADIRHLGGWRAAAAFIREAQLRSIHDGVMQVMARAGIDVSDGIVTAGIGASEAAEIAHRLGLPCVSFGDVIAADGDVRLWSTRCAAAVAVGMLSGSTSSPLVGEAGRGDIRDG